MEVTFATTRSSWRDTRGTWKRRRKTRWLCERLGRDRRAPGERLFRHQSGRIAANYAPLRCRALARRANRWQSWPLNPIAEAVAKASRPIPLNGGVTVQITGEGSLSREVHRITARCCAWRSVVSGLAGVRWMARRRRSVPVDLALTE